MDNTPAGTSRPSGLRSVTNLLLNLRGEHFRRNLNAREVRRAHAIAQHERGPSLPPLVPIQTLSSRVVIPSSSSAPSAPAKRPAAGPPPPRSWTIYDELTSDTRLDRDSREWRALALEPVFARLTTPPPQTDTLVHLCLQQIIELAPDILPELPLHMQRHALLYASIVAPLPGDILRDLLAAGGGEVVLSRSYGSLFLQRAGVLDAPKTDDGAWDDENDEIPEDDAQALHTLVMLDCSLPQSIVSRIPASLTHLALLAIPTPLPGVHRLPGLVPHLVFIDLSFNPWINSGETFSRIQWERWRAIKSVGLRGCALRDETSVTERITRGRIYDVEVYFKV